MQPINKRTMVSATKGNVNGNLIQSTLEWIADAGINGLGVLASAEEVANDHLSKAAGVEDAIDSVIAWRTTYAVGAGFVAGLGGIAAMPVTIPAGLAASYALGANTAAAIAYLRGYDIHSEQVRTMVLLCLIGEAGEEILKNAGIAVGNKLCQTLIKQIPGKVLIEINKKIGFRLVTKAGEKGVVNLMKMVPLAGGVIGGTFDGLFVNGCGNAAKKVFVCHEKLFSKEIFIDATDKFEELFRIYEEIFIDAANKFEELFRIYFKYYVRAKKMVMQKPGTFKEFLSSEQEIEEIADDSMRQISASVTDILATSRVQSLNLFSSTSQQEEFTNYVSEVIKSEGLMEQISVSISTPFENETEEKAFVARAKLVFKNRLRDKIS